MRRFLRNIFLVLVFGAAAAIAVLLMRSPDPTYLAQEWLAFGRYAEHDALIRETAEKHGVDPLLIKAVVWRESAFNPEKTGTSGERGLMQVMEGAAQDWAKAQKVETFVPTDLFEPRTNVEIGTWYLKRALDRWKNKEEPIPFALAEYNAGASRVDRWVRESGVGDRTDAHDLLKTMDFPTTRRYVTDILARYRYYQERRSL